MAFVIVDFLSIDVSKITFDAPKQNKFGGTHIGLKYDGLTLFIRYSSHVCPFGLSLNTDKGKVTGYTTSINVSKNDSYYAKAREVDEFFINQCVENSVAWGLGGSKTIAINRASIAGYDNYGDKGKWKRIVKYNYKINKTTNERVYGDKYPPRFEFGLLTTKKSIKGDDGFVKETVSFTTKFYDNAGSIIPNVNTDTINNVLPKQCNISALASWTGIYVGTFGVTIKPKLKQVRVTLRDNFDISDCILSDGEDEFDVPNAFI